MKPYLSITLCSIALAGCCISLPKAANKPCNKFPTYDPVYGCKVVYGESGCMEEDCPQTVQEPQALPTFPTPPHMYGYSVYQHRYGSGTPPIPTYHVIVPMPEEETFEGPPIDKKNTYN